MTGPLYPHSYNLRSRANTPANSRTPGSTITSSSKLISNPAPRISQPQLSLQLDNVIGTTTKNPSGLSSCSDTNTFAYCAGSVAVLAHVEQSDVVSHRYYRARPAAISVNPSTSYYTTPSSTPTRRRTALLTPRKEQDAITPIRAISEDENAKTWTARERIKSIKCVALSPNGRLMAVGETGYNPRVLLFSTSRDASSEVPLSIITDHTWGIKCVAFSPDSRFLATLGEANDGFLFVWSINPRNGAVKLCAANKCTTNICHMTWCGQRLITIGTRYVKVWHLPLPEKPSPTRRTRLRNLVEPASNVSPTPLPGRNCLLGDLAHATFTCAVPIDDRYSFVCTDVGALCVVDVSRSPAELTSVSQDFCPTSAMSLRQEPRRLLWAGGGGEVQEADIDPLLKQKSESADQPDSTSPPLDLHTPRRSGIRQSLGIGQVSPTGSIAASCLAKHAIFIDSDSNLMVRELDAKVPDHHKAPLSSHNEPVQGVQSLEASSGLGAFFTWSRNGEVRFWNQDAQLLRVEQIELEEGSEVEEAASNELKVLRYSRQGVFVSGDRFGVLKLTRADSWQLCHTARAHSAEVNDITLDLDSEFVSTCSRDRMVQVFRLQSHSLDLIQTTDDHIAAVNQLAFSRDGCTLLSCSSDRTIVVREKAVRDYGNETMVAFLQTRIITIKASPLSMCLVPDKDNMLCISALDRHVTKIDFTTGTTLDSFKVADHDGDDHAVLNAIQVLSNSAFGVQRSLLVGTSSTDKSVRVYDLDKQILLSKESAHTEGISDLALLRQDPNQLVASNSFISTGHDSTIMLWSIVKNSPTIVTPTIELTQDQAYTSYDSDNTPSKASPATMPPLRKVLTKIDIAEFVKSNPSRSPSLRDPSPARLVRKTSRLALASSAIEEGDENVSPALRRRASAEERTKVERRSPSPPSYATRRMKKPAPRGEVPKDFFTRQSEWLRRSPSPQDAPVGLGIRQEPKANKARLRRPPSVPTDLRARAQAQERRSNTLPVGSDTGSINVASEHTCQVLKTYKKRLQTSTAPAQLDEVEEELESVLRIVKAKKGGKRPTLGLRRTNSAAVPKVKRPIVSSADTSVDLKHNAISNSSSTSVATSPTSDSSPGKQLSASHRVKKQRGGSPNIGIAVDGLSILMEKTNLDAV